MALDLKKIFTNNVLIYVFSRYFTFFIQFVNSLLIAHYLGPYYLGIWGFITLVVQYLNQINFGISHSVNALISIHKKKSFYVNKIVGTSFSMLFALSLIIVLLFFLCYVLDFDIGSKYEFHKYIWFVVSVGVLGHFNSMFSTIFRVYGKVYSIAINQSSLPICILISILLFNKYNLLNALVYAYFFSFLLSLLVYIFTLPFKFKIVFVFSLFKKIQLKGVFLFIYNTSFYLIIISTRTFISSYYKVEEFGLFTFAYTFANVALLLLQSFSFLIFPKIINRFAHGNNEEVANSLNKVRNVYIISSHLLIHVFIFLYPILISLFPRYYDSVKTFSLVALTVILYSNSFGYTGLLIAKEKERVLSLVAFASLLINIVLIIVLIKYLNVTYDFVIMGTLVANLIFIFVTGYLGAQVLGTDKKMVAIFKTIFPVSLLAPYLVSLALILFNMSFLWFIIPVVIFIILNKNSIKQIFDYLKGVINNPNIINI